ncbi:hypothetical protein ACWER6_22975 [Streptomyces sp. NPDC004009]
MNVRRLVDSPLSATRLTYGAERQNAYYTIGPVTVAYVVLGTAAGAMAGTLLRRTWLALVAGPALAWISAAVLVRSRAVLLLDFPTHLCPGPVLHPQSGPPAPPPAPGALRPASGRPGRPPTPPGGLPALPWATRRSLDRREPPRLEPQPPPAR